MRELGAELANALVTNATVTEQELRALAEHFRALADQCQISGPRFAGPRRDAIDMHNRAVRRLRGLHEEARRAALADPDELLEIVA